MKIKSLESFNEEEKPEFLTVQMSHVEAKLIASLVGRMTGIEMAKYADNDAVEVSSEIYDCLVGGFFNRYYDGGLDDA